MKRVASVALATVLMATQFVPGGMKNVFASEDGKEKVVLGDETFSGDLWGDGIWTITPSSWDNTEFKYFTYAEDTWMVPDENCTETGFKFWMGEGGDFYLSQTLESLEAGTYELDSIVMGSGASVQLKISGKTDDGVYNDASEEGTSLEGYNTWQKVNHTFSVEEDLTDVTISFYAEVSADGWGYFDHLYMTRNMIDDGSDDPGKTQIPGDKDKPETPVVPDPVESSINVERNAAVDDDFITGFDVSSYVSIVNSGAKFYDFEGNELSRQGYFDLLEESGVNYIRIRVWNNPFDESGNGYGGGNNNLEVAKEIGQYATNAGMKVLIDFHYSDFWADPAKQQTPKEWADYNIATKSNAVYEYTKTSLETLLSAGVDVGMVQVGNETTGAICGESSWDNMAQIYNAGARAIREVSSASGKEILVAVHFTNPEKAGRYAGLAKNLDDYNVDYDVFASSYYPYWHGTIQNLTNVLKNVADTYGKKVMVAETSWAWTLEDGDGHENTVRVGNNDTNQPYDFSLQGQANEIASVAKAVTDIGEAGIGMFYWEPAWIPVSYVYDESGKVILDRLEANKNAWESNGSGWASSFAGEYDAEDAGKWYGGSAVDNQSVFDFEGKPLETLKIYNLIRSGAKAPLQVANVTCCDTTLEVKDITSFELPSKVTLTFNDATTQEVEASWDVAQIAVMKENGIGVYTIDGSYVFNEKQVNMTATIKVTANNLLTNPGFENGLVAWNVVGFNTNDATNNARTGKGCAHFWTGNNGETMSASQTVTVEKGVYDFGVFLQGGSAGSTDVFRITATVGDKVYESTSTLEGWKVWSNPTIVGIEVEEDDTEITVAFYVENTTAGVWGSYDDCSLIRSGDLAKDEDESGKTDETGKTDESDITENKEDTVLELVTSEMESVSKEVLASAKEKGISIKVESTTGTPTLWSFALIKNVDKDFDPTVTVGADIEAITNVMDKVISDTLKFTQVSFAHSGDLPGEAEVKLDLSQGSFEEGKTVYLYYFNPATKLFEFVDDSVYSYGYATFTMIHCSDYIVTSEKLEEIVVLGAQTTPTTIPAKAPETSDVSAIPTVALFAAGIMLLGLVIIRKRYTC